jgi:hypothetical protein
MRSFGRPCSTKHRQTNVHVHAWPCWCHPKRIALPLSLHYTKRRLVIVCRCPRGTGVICETRALPGAVIPAKAGIYSASHWECAADRLDSRFRGNDQCFEGDPIPNDASTLIFGNASAQESRGRRHTALLCRGFADWRGAFAPRLAISGGTVGWQGPACGGNCWK